jgi:hypothetical protein
VSLAGEEEREEEEEEEEDEGGREPIEPAEQT